MSNTDTRFRICPICEAACGLRISTDGTEILEIRGNENDVFSDGHTCAKGIALKELHTDPDRIRVPMIRKNGELQPTAWNEAYTVIQRELSRLTADHGRDSVALYVGNPTAHNIGLSMGFATFASTLGSKNLYTAGTVDQVPKQLASELMFGNDMAVPVPDILSCDYFLMFGANPVVSNGSFWVVPKIREKLRALKERGGKLVTVDPRRTETGRMADQHLFIRPGTDAHFLTGLVRALLARGMTFPANVKHADRFIDALNELDIDQGACGLSKRDIEHVADDICNADAPVLYGRVGTTLQSFGTLTSFLIEVVNLLTGALDKRGGAMFPEQPLHTPSGPYQGIAHNRFQSRVSGVPEVLGQMPVTVLAEEIETKGEGQIKGMICFAGNPVLSNPDSDRLSAAMDQLEFLVCIDLYHTETSAKADVILPGSSAFEDCHYDAFLGSMGYKNAARFSPAIFEPTQPNEWQIGLNLGFIAEHGKVATEQELDDFEDNIVANHVAAQVSDPKSGIYERDVQEVLAAIEPEQGVERILDLGIRSGRWGDHFAQRDGMTLSQLAKTPDGVDLGEIRANRVSEVIGYPDGKIDVAPDLIRAELKRLSAAKISDELMLIGRRSTRSNNTWLRNLPSLNRGSSLCDLYLHPEDGEAHNVSDGDNVIVKGPGGTITATVSITADIAKGVVCLPHGFEDQSNIQQANLAKGPNYNRLAAATERDKPSGTAALNGIPVSIALA